MLAVSVLRTATLIIFGCEFSYNSDILYVGSSSARVTVDNFFLGSTARFSSLIEHTRTHRADQDGVARKGRAGYVFRERQPAGVEPLPGVRRQTTPEPDERRQPECTSDVHRPHGKCFPCAPCRRSGPGFSGSMAVPNSRVVPEFLNHRLSAANT